VAELVFGKAALISGTLLRAGARAIFLWLPTGLGLASLFKRIFSKIISSQSDSDRSPRAIAAPTGAELRSNTFPPSSVDGRQANLEAGVHALNSLETDEAIRLLKPLAAMDCADTDVKTLLIKNTASHSLAVAAHHGLGRLDEAIFWWREHIRISRQLADIFRTPDTDDLEVYDTFWSGHLGHTAMMGIQAKRHLLDGTASKKRYLICPPAQNPGNRYLVAQMGRFFVLVDDHSQLPCRREYIDAVAKYFYIDKSLAGPPTYYWQVLAEVSRAWEESGAGPLLSFSPDELARGTAQRTALGVPPASWHACLHVRASGYKGQHEDLHSVLNADISTYDLAIDTVIKRGGWVIRIGDPSMPKLRPRDGVIDYAHSQLKSPEMDIFLSGTGRFYIGTSSGPAYVPTLYGVPSVLTNWFPTGTRPLNTSDLFIPKLHWYESEMEFAPFDDSMSQPLGHIHSLPQFKRLGISLRNNTGEEIRDAVKEMLDRLDEKADYTPEDLLLQACFDKVAVNARSYGNARMGRDFLRYYKNLLPDTLVAERLRTNN
jgi:putative glycosyltransferase (TIGR04372 family)